MFWRFLLHLKFESFLTTAGQKTGKSNIHVSKEDAGNPREMDTVVGLHRVRGAAFKLFLTLFCFMTLGWGWELVPKPQAEVRARCEWEWGRPDSTFSQLTAFLLLDPGVLGGGARCQPTCHPWPRGWKRQETDVSSRSLRNSGFFRGFQFSPALPSCLPNCQLCWPQARHSTETASSHRGVKSQL